MKARLLIIVALTLVAAAFTACAELDGPKLPDAFKSQLVSLRSENIEIDKKAQDLQKQIASLETQKQFNCTRAASIAQEAMTSLNLSPAEFVVDLDTLKIKSRRH